MKKSLLTIFTLVIFVGTIPGGESSNEIIVLSVESPQSYTVALQNPINLDRINMFIGGDDIIINQVFEGLYQYNLSDPSLPIIPCLASEHGQWSTDHMNFTVNLTPNITFHNGLPLTAEIVQWNFDRLQSLEYNSYYMNPDATFYPQFSSMFNSTSLLDSTTLCFHLNYPCPYLEDLLSHPGFSMIYPDDALTDTGMNFTDFIPFGTGPYIIEELSNTSCTLHRYQDYWVMLPKYEYLQFLYFAQTDQILAGLSTGEIDFAPSFSLTEQEEGPQLLADHPNIVESTCPTGLSWQIIINWDKINRSIHEAIRYAINYTALLDVFNSSYASLSHNLYPLMFPEYSDGQQHFEFNLTHARQILLDAAVVEESLDLSIDQPWLDLPAIATPVYWYWPDLTGMDPRINATMNFLQQHLRLIGVDLQIKARDLSFQSGAEYYASSALRLGYISMDIMDLGYALSSLFTGLQTSPVNFDDTTLREAYFLTTSEFDPVLRFQKLMAFQTLFLDSAPFFIPFGTGHTTACYNSSTEVLSMNGLHRYKFGIFSGEVITMPSSTQKFIPGYSYTLVIYSLFGGLGLIFLSTKRIRSSKYMLMEKKQ